MDDDGTRLPAGERKELYPNGLSALTGDVERGVVLVCASLGALVYDIVEIVEPGLLKPGDEAAERSGVPLAWKNFASTFSRPIPIELKLDDEPNLLPCGCGKPVLAFKYPPGPLWACGRGIRPGAGCGVVGFASLA